jgi:hypothetical protein
VTKDCGEAGHEEGACGNASCFQTTTMPVAYLMENDESKWLGWEPDYQGADRVIPLYKEKWKVAK